MTSKQTVQIGRLTRGEWVSDPNDKHLGSYPWVFEVSGEEPRHFPEYVKGDDTCRGAENQVFAVLSELVQDGWELACSSITVFRPSFFLQRRLG